MPKKILCQDCFFFEYISTKDPKTGATLLAAKPGEVAAGFCRRFPPTVMKGGEAAVAISRTVDWCGEAQPKESNEQKKADSNMQTDQHE